MNLLELFTDRYPRTGIRYPPRPGTKAVCRVGTHATGPDTALGLVNLSDSGARLRLREPLEVGQLVEVDLLAPTWRRPARRSGVVVWAREFEDGTCQAGIFFAKGLSPVDLRDLCQSHEFEEYNPRHVL
jgi:hypothetical protein